MKVNRSTTMHQHFQIPPFHSSHYHMKTVFKCIHLGERLQKAVSISMWTEGQNIRGKICIFRFILINVDVPEDAWKLLILRNIQLHFLCFLWAAVPVRWSHAAAAVGPLSGPSSAQCCPDPPSTVWSRRWKYRYNWLHLCDLGTAYRGRHKDITWLQEEEHGLSHQQGVSVDTWRASGCAGPRPRCFRHCSRRSRPCCLD